MILSRYCRIYPADGEEDSCLLFSTKKSSSVIISRKLLADIHSDRVRRDERSVLSELGFLVNSAVDEREEMLKFVDEVNGLNKVLKAVIVMNLDCNLACRYCFEGQRKGSYFMSEEGGFRVVDFLGTILLAKDGKDIEEIKITFYGGEPLLSFERVIFIAERTKRMAEAVHAKFSFSFITNGTLLTTEKVARLNPLGLKEALITLDGPRESHNRNRPFRNGNGSFDTIIKNVKDVCAMTEIQVGGNFTSENYNEFPKLLDFMLANGLTPSTIKSVNFVPVMMEQQGIAQPDFNDGCMSANEPWILEAVPSLREEILKKGFRADIIMPSFCMVEYDTNFVINHDGSIYKCPGLIGRETFKIGDIRTGIRDYRQSHNLDNWKNEECLKCAYLPLCFGGCRYMKVIRDGNMEGVDCKKPYFDACLETLVKQDIRYGLTG
jgi:uncharacterized protein